uniref:Syntaxin N-terminal domain-containing protein n=1 Tax=Timema shepardi TaxID=629360 RepID=A0A7R9AP99_TIMSH|nr:unnamed protein product [Timema shepardi]
MLLSSSAATCTPLLLTCPFSTEMEMQIQDTDDDTTALTRIKIVQHSTLSKLFMEAIQEYNSTLVRHRERCANLLKQQILITDKTVNYEELQELLDREESAIFVDNPLSVKCVTPRRCGYSPIRVFAQQKSLGSPGYKPPILERAFARTEL